MATAFSVCFYIYVIWLYTCTLHMYVYMSTESLDTNQVVCSYATAFLCDMVLKDP